MIKKVSFIELRSEAGFEDKVKARWEKALHNSEFIGGSACKEFSEKILDYTQTQNFIACANGTDAIQIALRAVGIGIGDKVLLPDFTFWATYEAIANVGAVPIMIDINPEDYQMDFDLFVQAIEEHKPKAAILVHLYGWCSTRLKDFRDYCAQKEIYLIEDGAQCMGSLYDGKPIFEKAFLATTSFYPAKVLGAAGDGGGIFSNNKEISQICTQLTNHGRSSHYGHEYIGWNSRLDELQAHFLIESLNFLPARISSRRQAEQKYLEFAKNNLALPLSMKQEPSIVKGNGYLQVSIANTSYKELSEKLKAKGIFTGNVYPSPMSAQKGAKQPIVINKNKLSNSAQISAKVLNLPLFPYITDTELNYVCDNLKEIIN